MGKKRYEQLKRKADRDELTYDDYLEILSYEKPDYYRDLLNVILNWDQMEEEEFVRIMDTLELMDQEYLQESIDHAIGYPDD